jgi:hypothetical protein
VTLPRTPHPIHLVVLLASRTSCSRAVFGNGFNRVTPTADVDRTLPPTTCT